MDLNWREAGPEALLIRLKVGNGVELREPVLWRLPANGQPQAVPAQEVTEDTAVWMAPAAPDETGDSNFRLGWRVIEPVTPEGRYKRLIEVRNERGELLPAAAGSQNPAGADLEFGSPIPHAGEGDELIFVSP